MEASATKPQTKSMNTPATSEQTYLRTELERRRERLHTAVHTTEADASLSRLLSEVDAALARMDQGAYGICDSCQGKVETDRLLRDPLLHVCLECLSQEEQRALESDLELAARIQRALLPPANLSPAGWHVRYHYAPAGAVSGDYCDLLESKDGLLFLLGDVSGKGVAASMLMSHLHATFRSLADAKIPLQELVEAANRLFCESTLAGQYATLIVGRAGSDGTVEYVSAGHVPLLHVHAAGATEHEATGVPLGMFCNSRFAVRRLSLLPGDSLLLYTDGLTESRNTSGDEYGIRRLTNLAARHGGSSPDRLISECLANLQAFSAREKYGDDLTVLVLRRSN